MDLEKIESALDELDNCVASLVNLTTLSDRIHVKALREALPDIAAKIRAASDLS